MWALPAGWGSRDSCCSFSNIQAGIKGDSRCVKQRIPTDLERESYLVPCSPARHWEWWKGTVLQMAQHRWNCWGKISSPSLVPCYETWKLVLLKNIRDFPGGAVDKNPTANAGYTGSIPGLGRSHLLCSNKVDAPQLLSQALGLERCNHRACMPQIPRPARLEPRLHKRSRGNEKHCNEE